MNWIAGCRGRLGRCGRSLAAAARLTRPLNCALTSLSTGVGALCTDHPAAVGGIILACLAAASVAAAGNGLNDIVDLPVDRLNRPHRPLPSGRLEPTVAALQTAALAGLGLALSWRVGPATGLMAVAVLLGLVLYSCRLKRTGPPGNLLVGALAAATFPFGAAAAGGGGRWWVPAAFALVYHGGREIVKGVEDLPGDRVTGVRTLALRRGPRAASRAAAGLFAAVALGVPLPLLTGVYGWGYGAAAALLDLFLLAVIALLWRGPGVGPGRQSRTLLVGMALGLGAVVLGEVVDRP